MPPERRSVVASLDLRYGGQHHEVTVPFAPDDLARPELIEAAFHRRHEELYGFASPGKPLEAINLHVTVLGRRTPLSLGADGGGGGRPSARGSRRIYLRSTGSLEEVEVLDGDRMNAGQTAAGPVVVDTRTTTLVVPESFDVTCDRSGSFVMQRTRGAP